MNTRSSVENASALERRSRVLVYSAVVAVVLLGTTLRTWHLADVSVTFDEYLTGASYLEAPSLSSYLGLVATYIPEHCSIYFILLCYWGRCIGNDIWHLRLLSILLTVPCFPLLYAITSRLFSRQAGLIALICFALSPMQIWWAQGIRPYCLIMPLAMLSLYSLARAQHEGRHRWILLNAAANLVLVCTFLTTLYLVFCECIIVGLTAMGSLRRKGLWMALKGIALLPAAAWILRLPHVNGRNSGAAGLGTVFSSIVGNDAILLNNDIPQPGRALGAADPTALANYALAAFFVAVIGWLIVRVLAP